MQTWILIFNLMIKDNCSHTFYEFISYQKYKIWKKLSAKYSFPKPKNPCR